MSGAPQDWNIALGEMGNTFAGRQEPPVLQVETGPATGKFETVPWVADSIQISYGVNDKLPRASITLNLGEVPTLLPSDPAVPRVRDWQLRALNRVIVNPVEHLRGRRLRVCRITAEPEYGWIVFEGFIEKFELGWSPESGAGSRSLALHCIDTMVAADREASQQMFGQWRRTRFAEEDLYSGQSGATTRVCVRTSPPLIFNPHGKPNCHPEPLTFSDGSTVYVFTDPGWPGAIPWTFAKILRYLQWVSLQIAMGRLRSDNLQDRIDNIDVSNADQGVEALANNWTSFGLFYGVAIDGGKRGRLPLNYVLCDPPIVPLTSLVMEDPDLGLGAYSRGSLLRAPADVACEGMSTLEAFALVADRAGILTYVTHEPNPNSLEAPAITGLNFAVPGHYRKQVAPGPGPRAGFVPGIAPGDMPSQTPKLAEGINLYVLADRTESTGTEKERLVSGSAIAGVLLIDDSSRRQMICVNGEPIRYEVTVQVLPGWPPNADWDVTPATREAALAYVGEPNQKNEWHGKYAVEGVASRVNALVGRYWVLNESGEFRPEQYCRAHGPWSSADQWQAFDWLAGAGITDLSRRGADGWSPRRRRFLPPLATDGVYGAPAKMDVTVLLSFDGGINWCWQRDWNVSVLPDLCAIKIGTTDLRQIYKPAAEGEDPEDPTLKENNFVRAYIEGRLRVAVGSTIEGDDLMYGYCPPPAGLPPALPWAELLDRRAKIRGRFRRRATNVLLDGWPLANDDTQMAEADGLAARMAADVRRARGSGHVTLPFWLRQYDPTSTMTYQLGDEVDAVHTGVGETRITLVEGTGDERAAPRIIGIEYKWQQQPAACSTTLIIEDDIYKPDDVMGSPAVPASAAEGTA